MMERLEKMEMDFVLEIADKKTREVLNYLESILHASVTCFGSPDYKKPENAEISMIRIDYSFEGRDYMISIKVVPTYNRGDGRKHYSIASSHQMIALFNNLYTTFNLPYTGEVPEEPVKEEVAQEMVPDLEEHHVTEQNKMVEAINTLINLYVLVDGVTIQKRGDVIRISVDDDNYYEIDRHTGLLVDNKLPKEFDSPAPVEEEVEQVPVETATEEPESVEKMIPDMNEIVKKQFPDIEGDVNELVEDHNKRVKSLGNPYHKI